jgi:hypothetical protein
MPPALDVYRDWLKIEDPQRPLNNYQLLRLKPFEDDIAKIRLHYQKLNAHVRKFAAGDYGPQSQQLLNELAKAMLCLTDEKRKREYDAALGRKQPAEGRRRTLEEILLAGKAIDQAQLGKARDYARAIGLETRDALVQQKLVRPDVVMQAYAESLGLPYVELAEVGVDEGLAPKVPPLLAREHSCVPVMVDEGQVLMASPSLLPPEVEEELRLRLGMPVRTLLCTVGSVNALVEKHYPKEAVAAAAAARSSGRGGGGGAGGPASQEQIKRRRMSALVAGNATVMVVVLVPQLLKFFGLFGFTGKELGLANLLFGLILGAAVGGTTYAVMSLKNM